MDAGASGEILRGEGISESAKAEVPPQTPPSWPRGFGVGTGVLRAALCCWMHGAD